MCNFKIFGLLRALTALGVACGGDPDAGLGEPFASSGENVGELMFELAAVPSGVACVEVTVTGPQTASKRFDVTSGASTISLTMDRLPLGAVSVTGNGYDVSCAQVGSVTPTWVADSESVLLEPGVVSALALTFRRNNPATASVNFVATSNKWRQAVVRRSWSRTVEFGNGAACPRRRQQAFLPWSSTLRMYCKYPSTSPTPARSRAGMAVSGAGAGTCRAPWALALLSTLRAPRPCA
jgi:hypothetical protein